MFKILCNFWCTMKIKKHQTIKTTATTKSIQFSTTQFKETYGIKFTLCQAAATWIIVYISNWIRGLCKATCSCPAYTLKFGISNVNVSVCVWSLVRREIYSLSLFLCWFCSYTYSHSISFSFFHHVGLHLNHCTFSFRFTHSHTRSFSFPLYFNTL